MEINLENSTVMDNASRDALLNPFIEKCTTPALIGSVMETLNNFYIDEGYVTTRAYVAPQDLRDGSLDIVIVEGRIESLQFDNTTDLTKNRVDLAFPVEPGDVLNINSLERGLDQLNVPASNKVTMNMIRVISRDIRSLIFRKRRLVQKPVLKLALITWARKARVKIASRLGLIWIISSA